MDVLRLAAFSEGEAGGNPAGVCLLDAMPPPDEMRALAREVGFSETVFACPAGAGWRARYFAPEAEVPFCGHATIALGAALARAQGDGLFHLQLNDAAITVEGRKTGQRFCAALQSPATRSEAPKAADLETALGLLGLTPADLNPQMPVQLVHAGADHLALTLTTRAALAAVSYDMTEGRAVMRARGWTTLMLAFAEHPRTFHVRNLFAYGGVYEDPATGAAAAAYAGYLHKIGLFREGDLTLIQGEDMGARSKLVVTAPARIGGSVRVSGEVRVL